MSLRLYNTLTRQKEPFEPLDPNNVRMYVCGPTVYDYAHIGNARPAIVFDVLFRLLRHIYGAGHVTYVRNITDIDDKINARALELRGDRNVDVLEVVRELTERTYAVYQKDVAALGNLSPSFMPRATEHVPQMIAMIRALIEAGLAYEVEGHVLFEVAKKADYGKLSRRPLDEMIAGARVDVAPYKRNAMDFVLWKPSDANTPGWDSPWGRGRPGWHLECSSMIEATMGEIIDIHGGGIDLVFPHHENEIAQSEGAHRGHGLARFWMHNGFLNVEGEKMSKSLGNFVTIHELLADWPGDVLRFNMLRAHYRQPMDWTLAGLKESQQVLDKWVEAIRDGDGNLRDDYDAVPAGGVMEALANDLNTPAAITAMHALAHDAIYADDEAQRQLGESLTFFGLGNYVYCREKQSIDKIARGIQKLQIEQKIEARNAARKARDFKESDRIRDELLAQGIHLKDGPDGTTWEIKR